MIVSEDGLYSPRIMEKADCGCVALILRAGTPGGPGGPTGPAEKQKKKNDLHWFFTDPESCYNIFDKNYTSVNTS